MKKVCCAERKSFLVFFEKLGDDFRRILEIGVDDRDRLAGRDIKTNLDGRFMLDKTATPNPQEARQ